jgi:hypothetical protein
MWFYIAGNAVRTRSMRLEPGQYGTEIRVKILNMIKTFFYAVSYFRNPSGIDTGHDTGGTGSIRI